MNEPVQGQPMPMATAPTTAIVDSRTEPNLIGGLLAGFVAALIGAALWAVVTVMMKAQIGFMAIAVGLLVAWAVRTVGKGSTPVYGIMGAVLALFGCVLGNLLSGCAFLAHEQGASVSSVTLSVLSSPSTSFALLEAMFDGMDLLFYGIAAYEGFKFGRRALAAA